MFFTEHLQWLYLTVSGFQFNFFIELLWETAYFIYKLHYFNHQIQLNFFQKCFSSTLNENETYLFGTKIEIPGNFLWISYSIIKLRDANLQTNEKTSFTHPPSCIFLSFSKNTTWLLLPKSLWKCVATIPFRKYNGVTCNLPV